MHSDELPVKQYAYLCWPPIVKINYQYADYFFYIFLTYSYIWELTGRILLQENSEKYGQIKKKSLQQVTKLPWKSLFIN